MSAPVSRWSVVGVFLRSFTIQGSWNYRTMLGSGFAFAMLPVLKRIFGHDPGGLRDAVARHLDHFNAHPYLSGVALGAAIRLESEGADPSLVRRFKTAVRGPLGGLGDALIWASWLPAVSLAALLLLWAGSPVWIPVVAFLVVYNAGHLAMRVWSFRVGLQEGQQVGARLGMAAFSSWTERVRLAATLLLGLVVGVVLAAPDGLGAAGIPWALLGVGAFLAGLLLGHRVWRPAAVLTVGVVTLVAAWGVLP